MSIKENEVLDVLIAGLQSARENLDPEMPIQMLLMYLYVARYPGITMKDMGNRMDLSQASCSRNVAALSKVHRLGKPGLDVVEAHEDPVERRRKVTNLTPRGKRVLEALTSGVSREYQRLKRA